jgi:hypothetical protein
MRIINRIITPSLLNRKGSTASWNYPDNRERNLPERIAKASDGGAGAAQGCQRLGCSSAFSSSAELTLARGRESDITIR